jgi:dsDNA-specific endonuclease/ATPase MutS2
LQLMVQSGLLVSVHPSSEFGIFKQLMIHIGDTQSIEFELSTYSSHLLGMKHFMENANGKTFFLLTNWVAAAIPTWAAPLRKLYWKSCRGSILSAS